MAQHILMHIEHTPTNKILHYDDGIVEVRDLNWKLLETQALGHEVTMLDMENQFNVIYEGVTPKKKAEKLRKKAKEEAQARGDYKKLHALEASENESPDDDPYMEEETIDYDSSFSSNKDSEEDASGLEVLAHRNDELEFEANGEHAEAKEKDSASNSRC